MSAGRVAGLCCPGGGGGLGAQAGAPAAGTAPWLRVPAGKAGPGQPPIIAHAQTLGVCVPLSPQPPARSRAALHGWPSSSRPAQTQRKDDATSTLTRSPAAAPRSAERYFLTQI